MTPQPIPPDAKEPMFNLDKFVVSERPILQARTKAQTSRNISRQRSIKGEFVKAIPLKWLAPAAAAAGKVLATALAIWFQFGRCKAKPFKLTTAILRRFSVTRKASYRALHKLEQLGLITVKRQIGKTPIITVNCAH